MKRFELVMLFFLIYCMHFPILAGAVEKVTSVNKLGDVVVSATRTEKNVDDAPAKVTVISEEDLEKFNIKTIDDALRHEAGVFAKRNTAISETTARVTMRGFGGQDQTLALIDGVPVNEGYFGGVSWDTINIENVQRIEITRGGGSALYGGNAMGGVINIITKKPRKRETEIYSEYGSNNTYTYGAMAGNRYDKFSVRLGYEAEKTDGYEMKLVTRSISNGTGALSGGYEIVDANGRSKWVSGDTGEKTAERDSMNVMMAYDVTDSGTFTLNIQRGTAGYSYERPNTLLVDDTGTATFDGYVNVGNGKRASISPSNYLSGSGGTENFSSSILYTDMFGAISLNGKLGYQNDEKWYSSPKSGTYDNGSGEGTFYGTRTVTLDIQVDRPLGYNHLLTMGAYYRTDDFDLDTYTLSFFRDEGSKLDKTVVTEGKDRLYAVYMQDEWRVLNRLTLYGGIRMDFWDVFDGHSGSIGRVENAADSDANALSPQIAAVWNPKNNIYVRASVSQAFRAPNIYELFRTWTSSSGTTYHGNPNLDPETNLTYEAGVDQYVFDRRMKMSATYFYSTVEDMIGNRKETETDYYTRNLSEAEIQGLELETSVAPLDWIRFWANWSLTNSEVKKNESDPATEGKHLPDYPMTTINTGCNLTWQKFKASLSGNYLGRIYTSEENDDLDDTYMGYSKRWVWDAKVTYTPVNYVECSLAVENLLDEEYYDYYPAQEQSYYAELRIRY